jgi:outer membrane autotransporter protein
MAAVNRRAAARWLALRTGLFATTSLTALGLTLMVATSAHAQSSDWQGANPGNWFVEANWGGLNRLPHMYREAFIDSGTAVIGSAGAVSANLYVGKEGGTGSLLIQTGGTLVVHDFGNVGFFGGAIGSVTVDGVGSNWTTVGEIYVGMYNSTGTVTITNGGTVENQNGYLGYAAGSTGSVTVDGTGSTWKNVGLLGVGIVGTGTLTIRNGATVFSVSEDPTTSIVGTGVGSNGVINIGAASGQTAVAPGTLVTDYVLYTGTGRIVFNHTASDYVFAPSSYGGGSMRVEAGTTILTGAGAYTGGTTISGGTLQLGNGGTSGDIGGDVTNNGTLVFNRSNGMVLDGRITGTGVVKQIGTGKTILTGTNLYSGGTAISGGTLQLGNGGISGSIVGDVTNNGTLAFNRSDSVSFSGTISGAGVVNQIGTGTTILTGVNTYTGATSVTGGTLRVNGSLVSAVTVGPGGTLGGSGRLGDTSINGGTLAPGNSIGTITVAGNLVLAAASTYMVEVNAAGQSDRTNVTGIATLGGSVQIAAAPGSYLPYRTYTILNATGGRNGTFSGASTNSIFLTPSLSYDTHNVFLTLEQTAALASVARTPNQIAAAAAVQSLGSFNPVYGAAATLATADQARAAYDGLSGEVHAGTAGVLIEDSRYVRNAVLGRLRQAPSDRGPTASLAIGGPATAHAAVLPARAAPFTAPPAAPLTFWAQGFGAWGRFGGDGNVAGIDRRLGGAVVGADKRLDNGWQLGFAAGFSDAKVNVSARQSSATIESGHVAVYGANSFGAFNLRAGAAYAYHRIDTSRTILFPGFADRATANYDGGTAQMFGEIGYGMALGNVAIEPFAGLAWVRADTRGFTETGGPAALAGRSNSSATGTATLGARFAASFALAGGMILTPRLSAAWQHAFDDVTPAAALAFASGGSNFTITGVPLAQDSALLEAGFDVHLTASATLGVSYLGQFAGAVDDHAVKGKLLWNF